MVNNEESGWLFADAERHQAEIFPHIGALKATPLEEEKRFHSMIHPSFFVIHSSFSVFFPQGKNTE
jgi:hypothetical protein